MSQNGERSTPSEEVEGASRDTASPDPLQAGHQPEPSLSPANAGTAGVPSTDLTTQQTQSSMDTAEADVGPNQITNGTAQSTNATMTNGTSKDTGTEDQRHENAVDGDTPMEDQTSTSKDALEDYDWQELENRFAGKMMECQRKEQELAKEFAEWVEVCFLSLKFCSYSLRLRHRNV